MKTSDKFFITILVAIICCCWILWLREFAQNRNLSWINVAWEAIWTIPANSLDVDFYLYATWNDQNEKEKNIENNLLILKELIKEFNTNINDDSMISHRCYDIFYDDNEARSNCFSKGVSLQLSWNIEEQAKKLEELIQNIPWIMINGRTISFSDDAPELLELMSKANKNAREKAEKIANSLWVKLWSIISFSRYNDDYYNYYSTSERYQHFPTSFEVNSTLTVYHTYKIK